MTMNQSGRATVITIESDDDDRADTQWAARFVARFNVPGRGPRTSFSQTGLPARCH